MRNFVAGIAGTVITCGFLTAAVPALGQYIYNPPPPVPFTQGQPLTGSTPVPTDGPLYKAPVVSPTGTVLGNFLRIEVHDGERSMGIVTLRDPYRTVAVPLERLRLDPAGGAVLTDLSWDQIHTIPSGIRDRGSPYYPFGRPAS
jgi:hypothetical protein